MDNKIFYLKTNGGEIIATVKCIERLDAIDYFASSKQISGEELLKIYKVVKK
tara:strand:- start:373 stop:528 length:156 start_codon:yes stop_codon:yes gene_type:complete